MKANFVKFLAACLAIIGTTVFADTVPGNDVDQIERAFLFPTPLVWIGGTKPSAVESQMLLSDINIFKTQGLDAGFSQLEDFLQDHPNSAWAPSLHVNMAEYYRLHGRYSLALKHWQTAWDSTKNCKDASMRRIAARALAGWTRLLASLGEKEQLHALFAEMHALDLPLGVYSTEIQETEEALNVMDHKPEISYRCGSYALGHMAAALRLDKSISLKCYQANSPNGGFSMAQLLALALTNGFDVEAVRRPHGAPLVVPCVLHWKLNHFAAITERKGDLYRVDDPTFEGHVWLDAATIDAESSGDFILPKEKVPSGWRQLDDAESAAIYGKGVPNVILDYKDKGNPCADQDIDNSGNDMPTGIYLDPGNKCGGTNFSCGCGMPRWYVSEPYITLWLFDSPASYYQSDGNLMELKISYKSRGNAQSSYVAGFGNDWSCNWIGMLQYDNAQDTIIDLRAGGGEEEFQTNGSADYDTARMYEDFQVGTSNYPALVTPTGEKNIYGYAFGPMSGPTNFLLTETIDRYGRILKQFNYQSVGGVAQLRSVMDMDGKTNTLAYGNPTYSELITAITNAYGHVAYFNYDANGLLTNAVDAQGMPTYFEYDGNDNVTNMITLYGTNSFQYFAMTNSSTQNLSRGVLITEPTRTDCQLYVYEDLYLSRADFGVRASYHWNRAQYATITDSGQTNINLLSEQDANNASVKYWLHDTITNNPPEESLSDTLQAQEGTHDSTVTDRRKQIVYSYQGQNALDIGDTNAGFKQIISATINGKLAYDVSRNSLGLVASYTNFFYYGSSLTQGTAVYSNYFDFSGTIIQYEIGPSNELVFGYCYTNSPYNSNVTNLLVAVTNAVGDVTRYTHDPVTLKLTSTIFPGGMVETNIYYTSGPSQGFLEMQADIGFRTNYFGYTNGNISVETNALGLVTAYEYDSLNRLISTAYTDGTTESNLYDRLDVVANKDRLNQWSYYLYNNLRELVAETNVNGQVTTYDYCGCGGLDEINQQTNGNWSITLFYYNMESLLTNAVYPDGYTLSYQYDSFNNLQAITDGGANSYYIGDFYQNGLAFQPWDVYINGINSATYQFDPYGKVTSKQTERFVNVTDEYSYDYLHRLISHQTLGGDGTQSGIEHFNYSALGMTNYIDELGHTNVFVRDLAGRVTSETNANLEVVKSAYNALDEPLMLTDGNNHTTIWSYDQYGHMTNRVDALGNTNAFQFDQLGRLTNRWTTAKGTTVYRYDPIGNLINIDYSLCIITNPPIYYAYDELNRLTNMVDSSGATAFTWTPGSQLASETGPWPADMVSFTYNGARQRSSMMLLAPNSSAWVQNYQYDDNMRVSSIATPADTFSCSYNGLDILQSLSAANFGDYNLALDNDGMARILDVKYDVHTFQMYYAYDQGSEITGELYTLFGNDNFSYSNNFAYDNIGQLITAQGFDNRGGAQRWQEQFGYTYDGGENLVQKTNNALVQTFGVNNLNELTGASRTGTFTVVGAATELNGNGPLSNYPGVTNVAVNGQIANLYQDGTFAVTNFSLTNGYNAFVAIASDNLGRWSTNTVTAYLPATPSYTYDANGNLTSDGTRNFVYDDENELVGAWVANTWSNSFVYDGMWRKRIERDYTWSGSSWLETNELHFVYDGNRVIQERDANNLPQVTYTWGATADRILQGDRVGGLLARTENSLLAIGAPFATAYYVNDRNGNVMYLMYSNNLPAAAYEYDPFGNMLAMSGPLANANRYRYSAEEWNDNAGLYYYGRRFYDSSLQRWLNQDPIQEAGGLNLYGYVGNDPVNRVDPLGLTFVVSPTPFPGQEGTYGPYVLNIPDGSSLVKPLQHLDPNSLYKNEYKTCQRLQSESPWEALNPRDEAGFDTPYFMGLDADDREYYEYNGEIFADNEINYFGIGMYENWAGDPLAVAIGITDAWKLSQYGQTPNANTFYWLEKGYNDYSGFTDPSQPAPSK